ncbi:MAG: FkbM family methyltransferase [Elusimicrobia bacterium]|nr:FkbM family methyltransferase [Elusimicrobiota bacterium]
MTDHLAERRARFLALAADIPARCRLVERSEGNALARKLRKLALFRGRYVRWAAARAGLRPGVVELPLFWGARMRLPYTDDADFVTFYLVGAPGGPEYKLARWFIRNLRAGDSFYDAGASYGFYTMLAGEFIGAEGEIHAFEPLPEIHARLAANAPGARVVNAALWDRSGKATMFRNPISESFNTLEGEAAAATAPPGTTELEVDCVTLDAYAKEHRPPTVIKIDVEGGEKRLLAGGLETLRASRPAIAMEIWPGVNGERFSLPACRDLLSLGYAAHRLDEDGAAVPLAAADLPEFLRSLPGIWDNLVFLPA